MDVSVIIVNYNTKEITAACIDSIFKFTDSVTFEIILVDNASNDGSRDLFSSDRRIIYIYNNENCGFGKANNIGVRVASGKYLFFLNSDTLLQNNVLALFYEQAEKCLNNKIAFWGTVLYDKDGFPNGYGDSFPSLIRSLRIAAHIDSKQEFCISDDFEPFTVDYVLGADIFTLKSVFEECDGFDEDYFMYYEESDLMRRARKDGYRCQIICGPKIIHLEGKSSGKISHAKRMMVEKSHILHLRKHYPLALFRLFLVAYTLLKTPSFFSGHYSFRDNIEYFCFLIRSF